MNANGEVSQLEVSLVISSLAAAGSFYAIQNIFHMDSPADISQRGLHIILLPRATEASLVIPLLPTSHKSEVTNGNPRAWI